MRLFIAIEFEKDFFENIQKKIDPDPLKAKFTDSYHLTLKFLGEVDDNKVDEIRGKLSKIGFESFTVGVDDIGFFPNKYYVKVIWVGLKDNDKLGELQRKVEESLSDIFERERRKFKPHITLARVKFVKDKESFEKNIGDIEIGNKEFEVNSFKLIKSTLTESGPIYEDIGEYEGIDL